MVPPRISPGGIDGSSPSYPDPYTGVDPTVHETLVWPAHAAQIAFWMLVLAALVVTAWWFLRGAHCWRCGRETGLCQHTRYDTE